ncbi:MAG: GvpL/GvpF family gas vesicle protein [Thermoanaerobaculia bacterium]
MPDVLYVYAIARAGHPMPSPVDAIDGSGRIDVVTAGALAAFVTPVDDVDFSQGVIDARAKDVEWLGSIGFRHQSVMNALMHGGTIIPLRAFTLFASDENVRKHLESERARMTKLLDRLDGKQEWTLRIEFDPQRWSEALVGRVGSLRALSDEIAGAAAGKAFLLRKKLDDEKKRASREAEQQVMSEVEGEVMKALACETVAETRQQRSGAFPQINVLIERDEESRLAGLREELTRRYAAEGVTLALTGPWPPYTFAVTTDD